jgi:ankyrin repeat protein
LVDATAFGIQQQSLVEHGAGVAAQDKQGSTLLHWLSSTGNVDFLSSLNLADNVADQDTHYYPLHFEPSDSDYVDFSEFHVQHDADVAVQDEHRPTSSHLASKNGHVAVAQFLVEHSAVMRAHSTLQTDEPTIT